MNNQRHPLAELSLFLLAILGFSLFGTLFATLFAYANGVNISELMTNLNENSPVGERNIMRFVLLLNHLFSFLIPSIFISWFLYKKNYLNFLTLEKMPSLQNSMVGILVLLVALPFVQYVFFLNKMMPLPEWMHSAENDTEILIKGLLKTDHSYEVFFNVLVIALIPAIGEELVFRGIVQQKIMQLINQRLLAQRAGMAMRRFQPLLTTSRQSLRLPRHKTILQSLPMVQSALRRII